MQTLSFVWCFQVVGLMANNPSTLHNRVANNVHKLLLFNQISSESANSSMCSYFSLNHFTLPYGVNCQKPKRKLSNMFII